MASTGDGGVLVGCDGHGALHLVAAFPHGQVVDDIGALYDDIAAVLVKHGLPALSTEAWSEPYNPECLPDYSTPGPCMWWITSEPGTAAQQRYEQVCAAMDARRAA